MRLFRTSQKPRLFVLGLDGSPLPLLHGLMRQGDLPNLARIFATGSAVEMDSSRPDVSAVAWTSINTGMNPAKHGIYGFTDRKPGGGDDQVMTSAHVRAKTSWELVSDAGGRAVAINVPLSYPPQKINGVVISDFLAPALSKAVYPTTHLDYLANLGYRIDTDPAVARESLESFIKDFRLTATKRAEATRHFMRTQEWDFFHVVFMETDRLHHFFWQYMEEDHPVYGPMFAEAYRHIDGIVGDLTNQLRDDDELIILSDHGFTTLKKEVYLNYWLQQEGYLCFNEGAKKGLASVSSRASAFSLDPGRIYANLEGREAGGSVPASAAPGLLDELAARVGELQDPETGDRVVKDVFRADAIYHGLYRDRAPDLLVMPHDGYDVKGTFEVSSLFGRGKLVGMHKYDNATLFIRGRKITVDHASVHDVLPTACHLMNIGCAVDVDGRSVVSG